MLSTGSAATTPGLGGNNVTTNAATVVLSGANSVFAELGALSDNRGSLSLLALRQFATAGDLSNEGTITLDAGTRPARARPVCHTHFHRLILPAGA